MFKPKPFKDAEVNPEPPQLDWQDYSELAIRFLWFYRKLIVGVILLAAVGVWSYRLANNPKSKVETDRAPTVERSASKYIPSASLDFSTTDRLEPEEIAILIWPSLPPGSASSDPEDSSGSSIHSTPDALSKLLETGTVEQLIEQSLKIYESWGKSVPSVGLVMCAERAKISRRLLQMELSDSQRLFALTSYIESISVIDSLNVASKMNISGTREALAEIDEKFSNHPDPTVFAKAHLAMTLAPLYDFIATGNLDNLYEFQTQFRQRIEKIAPDQSSLGRLAELSIAMHNKAGLPKERDQVILDLLDRLDALELPSAQKVAAKFRERLLFDRYELATLANLVEHDDDATRLKIQAFFQTLAENPGSEQSIYQVAIRVVSACQHYNKRDDAEALIKWLDQISDNIPIEKNRQAVKDALTKLRAK